MYPRLSAKEDQASRGEVNKQKMRTLVESGEKPGLIAFEDDTPIGWISFGPREIFPRLNGSKILAPIDDQPVWSIVCLFIAKDFRRQGVSVELLKAAGVYARGQRASILEGYPTDPAGKKQPDAFVWTGISSAYLRAGFIEVARRSPTRPIMHLQLETL